MCLNNRHSQLLKTATDVWDRNGGGNPAQATLTYRVGVFKKYKKFCRRRVCWLLLQELWGVVRRLLLVSLKKYNFQSHILIFFDLRNNENICMVKNLNLAVKCMSTFQSHTTNI